MKVPLPLSLKISLWLVLNLLLLSAAATAFFVSQGGVGWDSIVRSPAGAQLHSLANLMSGEAAAAPAGKRDAVLARFGAAQHAGFFIFDNDGSQLAGPQLELPAEVIARLTESRNTPPPPPGRGAPPDAFAPSRREPPRIGPSPRGEARSLGRFLIRTSAPAAYWFGLRAPFPEPESQRPRAATVIARVDSLRGLLAVLDLTPWLLGALAALGLSFLFWLPLVRSITGAVRQLSGATEKIAEGKFDTRVPTGRRDELGALGTSVNVMAERLDTLVNGQKRFLADVAHELGSPLGRLQVATEILSTRADPALQAHVADVREEVEHMAGLVSDLLAFTKAGLRARDAVLSPVALTPLMHRVLMREDAAHRVQIDSPANESAIANADLLERALGNLIRNALRYAPAGQIVFAARRNGSQVVIAIVDDGPGVSPDALARLGEPFYRPEAARTAEAGGTGLGLAIVREGITACRGKVVFRNRSPHGFEAEIFLRSG